MSMRGSEQAGVMRGHAAVAETSRRNTLIITGILLVSVVLRLGVALYLGNLIDAPPNLTDQRSYHALAIRLVDGYGYSFDTGWYPFTPPETPTSHWSFLYAAFLAAIYLLFGPQVLVARMLQAVLVGLLLPWGVYQLAMRLFPGRVRIHLLAMAAAAGYSYFVLYAATLMTESLYIVLLLWSLCAALDVERALEHGERVSTRLALYLGLSLGLATLLRQSILPWVPILFVWLAWRARPQTDDAVYRLLAAKERLSRWATAIKPLVIAGLVLVACILPFTVRNYRVYGRFLLLNSNTGYAMYSAQHPMHGTSFREYEAAPLPDDLQAAGLNEAELDGELLRRGIGFVVDDPGRYVRLSLSRAAAYLSVLPEATTSPVHAAGRLLGFGLYSPFMLYGIVVLLLGAHSRSPSGLALLFAVCYSVMHVLTWAMVRYRLPVDAVAMPFVAVAIDDLLSRAQAVVRRPRMVKEARF